MPEVGNDLISQEVEPEKVKVTSGTSTGGGPKQSEDKLLVKSVERAFRVLAAFNGTRQSLSLGQLAEETGLHYSAVQRFTHTLERLGYLEKDEHTRRLSLTVKVLDFGYHYTRSSLLVERATPYLLHLNQAVNEAANLTLLDGTQIVYLARFVSRHAMNNAVVVGTRLPAYCTAPGIAILSRLPDGEALQVLQGSDLRAHTPSTTWQLDDLLGKIDASASQGYATAFEEYFPGDLSVAAAILDPSGWPIGAINIGASRSRFTPQEVEERFSGLVVEAASAISYEFVSVH